MKLWNFSHLTLHMHVFVLFSIILLAVMFVIAYVHDERQQRREEKHDNELCDIKAELNEGQKKEDAGLKEDEFI